MATPHEHDETQAWDPIPIPCDGLRRRMGRIVRCPGQADWIVWHATTVPDEQDGSLVCPMCHYIGKDHCCGHLVCSDHHSFYLTSDALTDENGAGYYVTKSERL